MAIRIAISDQDEKFKCKFVSDVVLACGTAINLGKRREIRKLLSATGECR